MKFLVDMPLSPGIAVWLAKESHDASHASEMGMATSADTEILQRARAEGRVVVTADLDYPRLLAIAGEESPGLILFRGGNWSEQDCIEHLDRVLRLIPGPDLTRSIVVIEKNRIRRRRLPP